MSRGSKRAWRFELGVGLVAAASFVGLWMGRTGDNVCDEPHERSAPKSALVKDRCVLLGERTQWQAACQHCSRRGREVREGVVGGGRGLWRVRNLVKERGWQERVRNLVKEREW